MVAQAKILNIPNIIRLTKVEVDILKLISHGYGTTEIAKETFRSPYTISDHRKAILRKLEVSNMAHAVRLGMEYQII